MKVHLFTDNLGAGGAQRQLVGLAVMLQERGHEIKVCTYFPHDFYKSYLDENGIPNEIIPNAANTKSRIWAVRNYFKKERPDCVIAYQETPSLVACASKLLGCKFKLIVSERNTTQRVRWNERVRFFLYHLADSIVPNCYAQGEYLSRKHPWMQNKITVISNFVDLQIFRPADIFKRRAVPEILVVGSIFGSKNTKGFVRACKILKDRGINFHATLYGWIAKPNRYMIETRDLIAVLNLDDIITIKDKCLDIAPVYRAADFYCMPSFFEGTPNVLCEAIASGLPVLCSDVCDNSRYVNHGINGYLFDPYNINEMANTLEKLISIDDVTYINFCKNSRQIAEEKLSKDSFIERYIGLINN